jgi:hypothetical protein
VSLLKSGVVLRPALSDGTAGHWKILEALVFLSFQVLANGRIMHA